jgi:hypothetical protein
MRFYYLLLVCGVYTFGVTTCMLEASQNEENGESERRKMVIGPMNVTSEDVSRSKRMVDKRGTMTKEGNLVHLQVGFPPNTFGQLVKNI